MKTPTLETKRLILRPVTLEDAPVLQKHFNNWNIVKYTRAPWPLAEDAAESHLRDEVLPAIAEGKHITWVIVPKGEAEAVGRIDYRFYDDPPDRGFWLAEPYHGQGLMTEALTATQDYVFFDLGIERFVVCNDKSNIGSRRVKEKCGAVFLHERSDCENHLGNCEEVWEVTRENWTKIRERT